MADSVKSWPAPAKLNLFLHVVGRRPDGYHLLQTVFQFLDFGDVLQFVPDPSGKISRIDAGRPLETEDLCVRAARALAQAAGVSGGVTITLAKRIPVGGGLGGGSSDAATTLLALNDLWGLHWPRERLARLGLDLGADVPVFVEGQAAWAEGVGEQLVPVDLDCPYYVVVDPQVTVLTRTVFKSPDLTRDSAPITIRDFRAGHVRNDLEAVVRRLYPEVDSACRWLGQFGACRMSGSGACIFLAVASEARAQEIVAQCPNPWRAFAARGMNRHPLAPRADND